MDMERRQKEMFFIDKTDPKKCIYICIQKIEDHINISSWHNKRDSLKRKKGNYLAFDTQYATNKVNLKLIYMSS